MATNITEEHRHAFEALTSCDYRNFALFSVFVDGEPGAAIVAVNESLPAGEGSESEFEIRHFFQPDAGHDGHRPRRPRRMSGATPSRCPPDIFFPAERGALVVLDHSGGEAARSGSQRLP